MTDWTTDYAAARAWLSALYEATGFPHRIEAAADGRPMAQLRAEHTTGRIFETSALLAARTFRLTVHGALPCPGISWPETGRPLAARFYTPRDAAVSDASLGLPVPRPSATIRLQQALAQIVEAAAQAEHGYRPELPPDAPIPQDALAALDRHWRAQGRRTAATVEAPSRLVSGADAPIVAASADPGVLTVRARFPEPVGGDAPHVAAALAAIDRTAPAGRVLWDRGGPLAEVPLYPALTPIGPEAFDWAETTALRHLEVLRDMVGA
jgi:hypothetical protein